MKDSYLNKYSVLLCVFSILLLVPSLFYRLGFMPLIEDESIRALVALEMVFSGDYITPTLGGESYFNKPPLFNWIIVFFFKLTRDYSEFIIRLPSVIALLLFSLSVFLLTRKKLGKKFAFVNALALITCGRILFYDSMLGLIDITYSFITYLSFMSIYHFHVKRKYTLLFLSVYFLSALGFLMKGLPSIVFLGISLLVFAFDNKLFRMLISPRHLLGIIIFALIVGSYYLAYELKNPGSIEMIFSTLFGESSKRTAIDAGIISSLMHVFTFPFEFILDFLPWSLLVVPLFSKKFMNRFRKDPFIRFNALIFISNIVVYWISPNIHPRYLFMFIPLFYTVIINEYSTLDQKARSKRLIDMAFLVIMTIMAVLSLSYLFIPRTKKMEYIIPIAISLFLILTFLSFIYYKKQKFRLHILILFLLITRLQFNYVILNVRSSSWVVKCRDDALKVGDETRQEPLYLYNGAEIDGFEKGKYLNYQSMYYITSAREKILLNKDYGLLNALYVTYDEYLKYKNYTVHYNLRVRHDKRVARVVEFLD